MVRGDTMTNCECKDERHYGGTKGLKVCTIEVYYNTHDGLTHVKECLTDFGRERLVIQKLPIYNGILSFIYQRLQSLQLHWALNQQGREYGDMSEHSFHELTLAMDRFGVAPKTLIGLINRMADEAHGEPVQEYKPPPCPPSTRTAHQGDRPF